MATRDDKTPKPRLDEGIPVSDVHDGGMIAGRVGEEDVLLARSGETFFALGAYCTHYHGPLAEGLIVGETVRCPWHHACFSLTSGEAVRAPAFDPVARWRVVRRGDRVFVTEKLTAPAAATAPATRKSPESVVIIGGGAAGLAAAEMLRRHGYEGDVAIISADEAPPCDRPNLSKDYLAGEAKEEWIPLQPPEFYTDHKIELQLGTRVAGIDAHSREITLENGKRRRFGALLIATGAEPVRLNIPGADGPAVHYLRSLADSNAIIAVAKAGTRAVVIGASFIGLEVAASLRTRKVNVDVVAPERLPLEKVMGAELGQLIRREHESHGVVFHLPDTVSKIDGRRVTLASGNAIDADFVVVGIGVRPIVDLAERAGLAVDKGIVVNEQLETSVPGIFAAGDVARWRDPRSGERRRIEHWVVAERQGQVAARNFLGAGEAFDQVPFFWSQHYDMTIRYAGHAEAWDAVEIDGDVAGRDCAVSFKKGGRMLAMATVARDRAALRAEVAMETGI
jgi:NADPH-dependent 2,4-dienoyl-CoA reductase/sulfur reductase-like enzyme/nitrite reductase/ring-hydroxylating ferredoxin subunit